MPKLPWFWERHNLCWPTTSWEKQQPQFEAYGRKLSSLKSDLNRKKNAEIFLEDISSLLLTINIKHLFSLKDGEEDTGLHQGQEHSHPKQTSLEQHERAGRRKTN